jgi:hypothetical protein
VLIVTDLPPEVADACWYSMRSWIECMFKDGKRGGLAWHQTKMIHPKRAERHWLAIAQGALRSAQSLSLSYGKSVLGARLMPISLSVVWITYLPIILPDAISNTGKKAVG